MRPVNKLTVSCRDRKVGELTMTPDNRQCAFQYGKEWLLSRFSISPLGLPLKPDLFIAGPEPFRG
ncbi:MAG: HipA N-terminal domain-containing protein [Mediterranea sp.]|jgi:serine/threonine-protein kinase HipA|nr:HipA N-terminal domain-containing protein [Mediterranea sp.]